MTMTKVAKDQERLVLSYHVKLHKDYIFISIDKTWCILWEWTLNNLMDFWRKLLKVGCIWSWFEAIEVKLVMVPKKETRALLPLLETDPKPEQEPKSVLEPKFELMHNLR